jgi:hypothetical protein
MRINRLIANALAVATLSAPVALTAQQASISIAGTAKKEAKRPYTDNYVRARRVSDGAIAVAVPLDDSAGFSMADIKPGEYLIELVNKDGKIVCTEGPNSFRTSTTKVSINCGRDRLPLFLLLSAAGAAGITTGIIANDPASPSR